MPRHLSLAAVAIVFAVACSQGEARPEATPVARVSAVDLDDVVLPATPVPPGTDYLPERSGTLRVDELWPSDCCPSQQLLFEEAGFETAYARVFEKPGHSADPIDTRPGWEVVSSSAVLFRSEAGASEAMNAWLQYYESPALDALPADGLGEEAIAVKGSPEAPAETLYLYLWRIDRAVLSLRASVGTETVQDADVRALVDRMKAGAR